jgi:hypothetical protein
LLQYQKQIRTKSFDINVNPTIIPSPNLRYACIHPNIDYNHPAVNVVDPNIDTTFNNSNISEEHYQVDIILHQFKAHIPAELDSLDEWSEFVQTDNSVYHCYPDSNNLLKNSLVSTSLYNHNTYGSGKLFPIIVT